MPDGEEWLDSRSGRFVQANISLWYSLNMKLDGCQRQYGCRDEENILSAQGIEPRFLDTPDRSLSLYRLLCNGKNTGREHKRLQEKKQESV